MTRRAFRWGPRTVSVDAGDASLAGAVSSLFPALEVEPPPDGPADLSLRRGPGGYTVRGAGEPEASPTLGGALAVLEHRTARLLAAARRSAPHLHAAAAVVDGGAVVAFGPSGSGKSSLAAAWSQAGLALLSDDLLVLGEGGRVEGLPRLVKLDAGALAVHGLAPEETVAPEPDAGEFWLDPRGGGGWAPGPVPVTLLARVSYRPGAGGDPRPLGEPALLRALADALLGTGAAPGAALDSLIALVRGVRGFDVPFSAAPAAAERLAGLAREGLRADVRAPRTRGRP